MSEITNTEVKKVKENATGRRKAAVARVYFKKGSGNIVINNKESKDYLPVVHLHNHILAPLKEVGVEGIYDIKINVKGGGIKGQAEAIRLAISKMLCEINPEFRSPLKAKGWLTRDARVVERKKYGKPKARKSFQFSKR